MKYVWLAVAVDIFLLKQFWASVNILLSTEKVLTCYILISLLFGEIVKDL
jgi:hypothetical protein